MIDPFTALAAVSTAVKLVKKTIAVVQDVESLGPVLGKYFSAKADAIAVVKKGGFSGSAKGQAIELEMAIEAQREFEEQLKGLFFSSNKMDIWMKIKARATEMEAEAARAVAASKRAAAKKKQADKEAVELALVIFVTVLIFALVSWVSYEAILLHEVWLWLKMAGKKHAKGLTSGSSSPARLPLRGYA